MELRVGNKYRLGRKIGSGSFGDIYLGLSAFVYIIFSDIGVNCDHCCNLVIFMVFTVKVGSQMWVV